MRPGLIYAAGLATLVVGGVLLIGHIARGPDLGTADAVAIRELQLRDRPQDGAPAHAFIVAGSPVRVEGTAAPGWVYVYQRLGTGAVLEGYVRSSDVGPPLSFARASG